MYISEQNTNIFKAKKELKGFEKIELKPNEEKKIKISLTSDDFSYYNVETNKWSVEEGKYNILIGKSSRNIVLQQEIFVDSKDTNITKKYGKHYQNGNIQDVTLEEFEELLGRKIPDRYIRKENITEENTLEKLKDTNVGKVIYEHEIKKMNQLLEEQNVNKATKVMMDLQKPLKKFYEKKSSKYTKEMVNELLEIAKNNLEYNDCKFFKEYIK